MNKKVVIAVLVILVFAGGAGYKFYANRSVGITATGTVEVTHTDIMPKVSGYITDLSIKAGDTVTKGQVIAHIDRPDLAAQLVRDQAALEKAKVQLAEVERGSRYQEVAEAEANVTSNRSVFEKAKADLARYQTLFDGGGLSAQQLDAAKSSYQVAYNALLAAQSKLSLLQEGSRTEDIQAARLEVERCQAVVDASKTQITDMTIISPLSGRVLSKNYESGEYAAPGSAITTIGDMSDCWVKIYISSTQLGLIQPGQEVKVHIDSFPDTLFTGVISEISDKAEYTPRQSLTDRERTNLVHAVKVKLANEDGRLKPGMPADVTIQ